MSLPEQVIHHFPRAIMSSWRCPSRDLPLASLWFMIDNGRFAAARGSGRAGGDPGNGGL